MNKKVYIVMESGGYNENVVGKVFDSERKALDYVIGTVFKGNSFYEGMRQDSLDDNAKPFVEEHDVE